MDTCVRLVRQACGWIGDVFAARTRKLIMGALLGFAPFIGFAVVEKLLGVMPGLAVGALVSIALLVADRLKGQREVNILEAGSAVMFTVLAGLAFSQGGDAWSLWRVRLWVDAGLLLIVVASIMAGRPFTLHHARRRVSAEVARSPRFLRTNNILSGAWALAFAVLVVADLLMVLRPETPVRLAVVLTLAALAGAAWFTKTYTARVRGRQAGTDSEVAP
jgi:hypothetical protein